MKEKIINLLKSFHLHSYLAALIIALLHSSCEEESIKFQHTFSFQNYAFAENIVCYDSLGNRLDSAEYMYTQDDFIFFDEFELPNEQIEIFADSSVVYRYTAGAMADIKKGTVSQMNDTLFFFTEVEGLKSVYAKGVIVNDQLRLNGYGYIYYTFLSNGVLDITHEEKIVKLGDPDLQALLEKQPPYSISGQNQKIELIYLLSFDLLYEK